MGRRFLWKEYELAVEQRQGDQETVDMNLDLQGNFRDCRVYLEDLNRSKSLITGAEFKEAYAKKWIRSKLFLTSFFGENNSCYLQNKINIGAEACSFFILLNSQFHMTQFVEL
jgi:hypothetical protein